MSSLPKRILYLSMGLAGVVAVACVADLVMPPTVNFVFGRSMVLDVIFLVAAGLVIYLSVDALREQK
jgi:hypothetical protein